MNNTGNSSLNFHLELLQKFRIAQNRSKKVKLGLENGCILNYGKELVHTYPRAKL